MLRLGRANHHPRLILRVITYRVNSFDVFIARGSIHFLLDTRGAY
jgi:hypothetical protein